MRPKLRKIARCIIIIMAANGVLYGQMIVKNSLETEVMRVTSDGLVGISITNPQALLHVEGYGVVSVPSFTGPVNIAVSGYFDNTNVDQNLTNKFALSGIIPVASVSGTLSGAIHGNMISEDPNNALSLAAGGLAGSRNQGTEKYLYGVRGIISALNAPGWLDANPGFWAAAVYGSIEQVTPPHEQIYAGYFEGAKSYFDAYVGIGTTNPQTKMHVKGKGGLISIPSDNGAKNITAGVYLDELDELPTVGAANNFALSSAIRAVTNVGENSGALHGVLADPASSSSNPGYHIGVGSLGGSRITSGPATTYVYGVQGLMHASNAKTRWLDQHGGYAAAVRAQVDEGSVSNAVFAGYFEGAKSYFSTNVGIGTTAPSSALDVAGDVELASNNAFYLGDPNTDGSWRIIRSGANLVFQSRKSGFWTNGTYNTSGGAAIILP